MAYVPTWPTAGCLCWIVHVSSFKRALLRLCVALLRLLLLPAGSNTKLFMLDDSSDEEEVRLGTPLIDAEAVAGAQSAAEAPAQASANRDSSAGAKAAIEDYQPITYNYSFFHLIFALASMYIAMLMTGWGAVEQEKDRLDVGWTSVWVKTAAEWVTALLYTWTLIAPALLPDRDWGY